MHDPIYKIVGSLTLSSLAALLESLQAFEGVIQTLGLPLLCVAGFAYAIVKLYQTILKLVTEKVEDANTRMADAKAYADKLEVHVEKGADSRAKLIELSEKSLELNAEQLKAQARMAIAMDSLTHEIRRCQQTHMEQ
jgi:F0F1-type ATP synthase membrane subunit b/b'